MAEFRGRTVVITGASLGIGLETARALAGQGARIVMVVRSQQRGEAAIANIRGTVPGAYFATNKIRTPTELARDDASARKLWELSERLCSVTWS